MKLHDKLLLFIFLIFFIVLVVHVINKNSSEESRYSNRLNYALCEAGNNKEELKKVLDYYREDSLKFDAACFLIENMPYHYTSEDVIVDSLYVQYFKKTDSIYTKLFNGMTVNSIFNYTERGFDGLKDSLKIEFEKLPIHKPIKGLSDVEKVKADFLIDNIDFSFKLWKESPLLKKMDYEDFKEYILPYRSGDEPLLYKRSELANLFKQQVCIDGMDKTTIPISRFKAYFMKQRWLNSYIRPENHLGVYDLFLPAYKMNCHNNAMWTCDIFRSLGVPIVYEYTSQWVDRERKHFWCACPDSNGIFQPFTPPENNLLEDWEESLKYSGKVYRKKFAINEHSPYFLKGKNENIPNNLYSSMIEDVTYRYHPTVTLKLELKERTKNKLAYLSFINRNGNLSAVAWGKIDKMKREIIFEQVPVNMVFVLSYFIDNHLQPMGNPFFLYSVDSVNGIAPLMSNIYNRSKFSTVTENESSSNNIAIKYLLPDDNERIMKLKLLRKYPHKPKFIRYNKAMKGAVLLASNNYNGVFDTLVSLPSVSQDNLQDYDVAQPGCYRYYLLKSANQYPLNLAHLEFIGSYSENHLCKKPTPLPVFDTINVVSDSGLWRIDGIPLKTSSHIEDVYDNDRLTYVSCSRVGMDFKTPVTIAKIRLAPRTANNMIVVGDRYELNYYDNGRWIPLHTVRAKYNYIELKDVPSNALFLLKNIDNGSEELPYLYLNNQQIFINMLNQVPYSLINMN
jgi:hypothetical protein